MRVLSICGGVGGTEPLRWSQGDIGEDKLESSDLLAFLTEALQKDILQQRHLAVGICYDVRVRPPDFPATTDAICASVQDQSGQASDVNPACAVRGADSSVTIQREAHRLADFARAGALGCDGNGGLKTAIAYSSPGLPLISGAERRGCKFFGFNCHLPRHHAVPNG